MAWVTRVFYDPQSPPYASPSVDILDGGKLTSNDSLGHSSSPLQSSVLESSAVSKATCDAASQDALNGTTVE